MLEDTKLVLFDLDNTLYPFDLYWTQSTTDTFYGSSLTNHLPFDQFLSHYRHYDEYFWELHHQGSISLDEVRQKRLIHTLQHFGQDVSNEEANLYFHEFFNRLIQLIKPDEEVNAYLQDLKRSYKLGMITNGKTCEQRKKIAKLRLLEVFTESEIFISEEMRFEKPQIEAFHTPLLQYGIEPEQAVFVGDSWSNDVVGAINSGMSAIWINSKRNKPQSAHKPLFMTENIRTLKEKKWMSFENV